MRPLVVVVVPPVVWVFLGGGAGSALRYAVGFAFQKGEFPFATALVNLVGSFAIGALMRVLEGSDSREPLCLLLVVGLLGGFTTFSAFSYDNLALIRSGGSGQALANIALQVVGGIALAVLGYALMPASGRA